MGIGAGAAQMALHFVDGLAVELTQNCYRFTAAVLVAIAAGAATSLLLLVLRLLLLLL